MSVNPFPDELCLKPAELYLLLKRDRMLWILCDKLEEAEQKHRFSGKKLKAASAVHTLIMQGSTRDEMIEKVRDLNYKDLYAEKLVDKIKGKYLEIFDSVPGFCIRTKRESKKGMFGKPGSRNAKHGRPPAKYKLEKSPDVKTNKRLEELTFLVMLLSGSLISYFKLNLRMARDPKIREAIKPFADVIGKSAEELDEIVTKGVPVLEELIDKSYNQLLEPIWEELSGILSLNKKQVKDTMLEIQALLQKEKKTKLGTVERAEPEATISGSRLSKSRATESSNLNWLARMNYLKKRNGRTTYFFSHVGTR